MSGRSGTVSGQAFTKDITAWVKKANGNVDAVIRGVALKLGATVIMRTPVDTGRARANWRYGAGRPDLNITDSTDNQSAVTQDGSGASSAKNTILAGILTSDIRNQRSMFITNALPYIKRLEYGWSVKQAPQGMVRLTVAEFLKIAREQVALVRRSGKAGTP